MLPSIGDLEYVCMLREVTSEDYVQLHFEYFLFQKLNNPCDTPRIETTIRPIFEKRLAFAFWPLITEHGVQETLPENSPRISRESSQSL